MQPKSGGRYLRQGDIYQKKIDGLRVVAIKNKSGVELFTREGARITDAFPELVAKFETIKGDFVADGEVYVPIKGRPHLGWVLSRKNSVRPSRRHWRVIPNPPARYCAFDLLEEDGQDIRHLPLEERLVRLQKRIGNKRNLIHVVESYDDGVALFTEVYRERGEGIVAKKRGSRYLGKKSDLWLKYKTPGYKAMTLEDDEPKPLAALPPPPQQSRRRPIRNKR